MNNISELDESFDDIDEQEENNEDFDDENFEGKKKGNQDLNRVLNFYGDMDKPDNKRKIENQKIADNQRDW